MVLTYHLLPIVQASKGARTLHTEESILPGLTQQQLPQACRVTLYACYNTKEVLQGQKAYLLQW